MKNITKWSGCFIILFAFMFYAQMSNGQPYEGIGNTSDYVIRANNNNSGYYFNSYQGSNSIFDHNFYVNVGDSVELTYISTSNSLVSFFVVYSPTGPKDTFKLTNVAPHNRTFIKSYNVNNVNESGIWIVKPFKPSSAQLEENHKFMIKVYDDNRILKLGRTFLYQVALYDGGSQGKFNFNLYTVNPYGYKYKTTYFDLQPVNGALFASPYGLYENGKECVTINKSTTFQQSNYIMPYQCSGFRKLFLNPIDPTLPESAPYYDYLSGTTKTDWLNPYIKSPKPIHLKYIPSVEDYRKGYFEYQIDSFDGNVLIKIDVNNNGSYTDNVDYNYYKKVESGYNYLYFNGKDNLGNDLDFSDKINVLFEIDRLGENHIILSDIEGLVGVTQERLSGANLPDYTLSWNDSLIGQRANYNTQLTGSKLMYADRINSNVPNGVHGWINSTNNTTGWGNYSYIDNFSYLPVDTLIITDTLFYKLDNGNLSSTWPTASMIFEDKNTSFQDAVWLGDENGKPTLHNQSNIDHNDGVTITQNGVQFGTGTINDPYQVRKYRNFHLSLKLSSAEPTNKTKWAVWIDVNNNGNFNDDVDVFLTDSVDINTGALLISKELDIPLLDANAAEQKMVFRAAVTQSNITLSKSMNGAIHMKNGEIEDYYLNIVDPQSLPLDIIKFNVSCNATNHITYDFVTGNEEDIEQFKFQFSEDGRSWKDLDIFLPQESNELVKIYNYTVYQTITQDRYFYRIQILERSGNIKYSVIKILNFKNDDRISIYPNPANDILTIQNLNDNTIVELNLYDISGKVIPLSFVNTNNRLTTIDVSMLTEGIYVLKIVDEFGTLFKKFVVN